MIFYQINEKHASFSFAIEQEKKKQPLEIVMNPERSTADPYRTVRTQALLISFPHATLGTKTGYRQKGKPSSSKKRSTFALWLPRMDQNVFLQRFEMPQPRKAISHGSNSGSQKKPSKGAAVFPEVKRIIKRLKRTPANPASASSTLNQPWFRSGRLNRPGLNQRKLQCSLAVPQIGPL